MWAQNSQKWIILKWQLKVLFSELRKTILFTTNISIVSVLIYFHTPGNFAELPWWNGMEEKTTNGNKMIVSTENKPIQLVLPVDFPEVEKVEENSTSEKVTKDEKPYDEVKEEKHFINGKFELCIQK